MKRKFISVQGNKRITKIYLDDLTKIHQIIKKDYPKLPIFEKSIRNDKVAEDS